MRALLRVLSLLLLPVAAVASQQPHLEGRVVADPTLGLLDGALCTSRFAPRKDLRFLLAAPLNVKSVSDAGGLALDYDGESGGRMIRESREYVVRQRDEGHPITTLCVAYRGAVPVFDQNTATSDWKGRITAIQGTMRVSEQTRWYPTLFDSVTGRDEQTVTFRLEVSCATCRGIYVNGARPVRGTYGRFESATPRQLLLFAGDFAFVETDELTFIAGAAGPDTRVVFSSAIRDIGAYYTALLGTPFRERPVLLSFLSVSRDRRVGVAEWQFVTWPTIAFSGDIAFDSVVVRDRDSLRLPSELWTTLSHEMGHFYFGTLVRPVGPLRWFGLESTAEFLSLKAVYALRGDIAGAGRLTTLAAAMGTTTLTPLDRVTREDDISGTYRYQYAPVFLHSLERRVGEERVIGMLRHLLALPDAAVFDFATLARAAESAGIPPAALTTGWAVSGLRDEAFAEGRTALAKAANRSDEALNAVAIAAALVNADTTLAARLSILGHLRLLVRRDQTLWAAHYQIGKIGALTGRELDVAQRSLELYLRHPVPAGGPGHASALWRLGMIEEHRGRLDRAGEAYRAALEREPNYAPARDALRRLASDSAAHDSARKQ